MNAAPIYVHSNCHSLALARFARRPSSFPIYQPTKSFRSSHKQLPKKLFHNLSTTDFCTIMSTPIDFEVLHRAFQDRLVECNLPNYDETSARRITTNLQNAMMAGRFPNANSNHILTLSRKTLSSCPPNDNAFILTQF